MGLSPQAVLLVLGLTADPGWHGNEAPSHLSISGHLLGANHLAPKCCSDRLIWQLKLFMTTLEVSFWPNWPRRAVKDAINNITEDESAFHCVVGQ